MPTLPPGVGWGLQHQVVMVQPWPGAGRPGEEVGGCAVLKLWTALRSGGLLRALRPLATRASQAGLAKARRPGWEGWADLEGFWLPVWQLGLPAWPGTRRLKEPREAILIGRQSSLSHWVSGGTQA